MGFNSKIGGARNGKGVIAVGPQRARCTQAMTTQTHSRGVCTSRLGRTRSEGEGVSLSRSHVTLQSLM